MPQPLLPEAFHNTTRYYTGADVSNLTPPGDYVLSHDAENRFAVPITVADRDAAYGLIAQLQSISGVSSQEINALIADIEAGIRSGDRNVLSQTMQAISGATVNAENAARFDEAEAEAAATIARNVTDLETLGTDTNNLFDERISRLSGFLNNPSSVRSDASLAAALGEVENAIDTQVNRQRTTAAKGLSDAGIRASGKLTDRVANAELLGTAQKGLNFSNLLGGLRTQRDTLQTDQGNFNLALTDSITGARAGGIPQLTNLTQLGASANQPIDYTTSGLTALDIDSLNQGAQQQDFGNFLQVLSLGAGIANNSIAAGNSLFGQGGALSFRG